MLATSHAPRPTPQGDLLARLFQLAAPDTFHFRLKYEGIGRVEGLVLYLPMCDGGEKKDFITLHEGSRAIAFWKGRLIPYASVPILDCLLWLDKKEPNKSEQQEMQTRTMMLLFFDATSQVDGTKFHLQDDLQKALVDECAALCF